MKRVLYGALAAAAATAALAAPPSAAAAGTTATACTSVKPAIECVRELAEWLVTYDPCLSCELRDEVDAVCETVFPDCQV